MLELTPEKTSLLLLSRKLSLIHLSVKRLPKVDQLVWPVALYSNWTNKFSNLLKFSKRFLNQSKSAVLGVISSTLVVPALYSNEKSGELSLAFLRTSVSGNWL